MEAQTMTSLSDNAIILNPRRELTRPQQTALKAIAFFRRQKKTGSRWIIGDARIPETTISDLQRLDLVGEDRVHGVSTLRLTTAGGLAAERLRQ
jgi:hypothetical protein